MSMSDLLLLLSPGWPLLLLLPWLRRLIPRIEYVALLPVIVLLLLPDDNFVELPWLLFNASFSYVSETRVLLLMAVLLWLPAAFYLSTSRNSCDRLANDHSCTFFLLTLGGYLGAVLVSDVVSFFTFSTLMGYGFYGLLVTTGDEAVKRAGRVYLCFMVVADLLLFEAVLIAASVTEEQSFDVVRETMADSSLTGLYLSMVALGFALKSGVWPFHFWLPLAFRTARPPAILLLAAVPVAISLLGVVRWLPLGEIALPVVGMIFQAVGTVAIAYAVITWLMQRELKTLPAYVTIFATGLFTIAIGTVLDNPVIWKQYAELAIYFIALMAIAVALLTSAIGWREARKPSVDSLLKVSETTGLWFERWSAIIIRRASEMGFETLPRLRASCLTTTVSCLQIDSWKKAMQAGELILQRWPVAVIIFLLVCIMAVLLLIY
ncbi:MAG: proton-conducting transporter membrane subunit [Gammaproteobacteria bacterium]|nr:proton-conducting transporter membrane subunit [Gammaproteobacteria bacterium]